MNKFIINLLFSLINQCIGLLIGIYLWHSDVKEDKRNSPHFVVIDMVQCKAGICNAVLTMDDIAILVPYDSTKVHVGDTLYITK